MNREDSSHSPSGTGKKHRADGSCLPGSAATPPRHPASKADWRRFLRHQLGTLSPIQRAAASTAIRRCLVESGLFAQARRKAGGKVSCLTFASAPVEPDLLPLLGEVTIDWVFPRVLQDGELGLHLVRDPARDLRKGAFGLLEPDADRCPELPPEQITIVLVPGLGFGVSAHDPGGPCRRVSRIGKGGGYFDRLIPRLSPFCQLIGVGFELQWFPQTPWPVESHDQALDAMVSESGWLPPGTGKNN